jgi:hypothetical protein
VGAVEAGAVAVAVVLAAVLAAVELVAVAAVVVSKAAAEEKGQPLVGLLVGLGGDDVDTLIFLATFAIIWHPF